jgi:hypothetical protein
MAKMDNASLAITWALGLELEARDLGAARMALRAVVVYVVTVAFVRLAKKRFMGGRPPST